MTELSNTNAGRVIARIGKSSAADPGPLRVIGVSRDVETPAILVAFNRSPSDEELGELQERLQLLYRPKLQPACAWPFPDRVPAEDSEGGDPR